MAVKNADVNHGRHGREWPKVGNICQSIDMQMASATLHNAKLAKAIEREREREISKSATVRVHMSA